MPKGPYCSAPWVESHLYHDGQTRPCDHNQENLGNWQKDGIEAVWRGKRYQEFRKKIFNGEFPNEQCRSCYLNQTTSKLGNHVRRRFHPVAERVMEKLEKRLPEFESLAELQTMSSAPTGWRETIDAFFRRSSQLRVEASHCDISEELSLLEELATISRDYFSGELNPSFVAPCRQARLINKCNARCVMCAGKFNGDIVNGPGLSDAYTEAVLAPPGHIYDFASETSEFLLYSKWKEIVRNLAASGLPKLRVFTNGMLMNQENASYLIDSGALDTLHFSMNGGTKETIETGQVNVRFHILKEHIRNVFAYAQTQGANFNLVFSLIIMRRNYREIPSLLRLIDELRGPCTQLKPMVYLAYLESNNDMDNYREFLFQEHHSLVDQDQLLGVLRESLVLSTDLSLPITLCEESLDSFLSSQRPAPKLVCKQRDIRVLANFLKRGGSTSVLDAVTGVDPRVEAILDKIRGNPHELSWIDGTLDRDLVLSNPSDVRLTGFAELESSSSNKWRWAIGGNQTIEFMPFPGLNRIKFRLQVPFHGTELKIRHEAQEIKELVTSRDKEIVEGALEFISPNEDLGRQQIQIATSIFNEEESRFTNDERPLAYSVYAFEHLRA